LNEPKRKSCRSGALGHVVLIANQNPGILMMQSAQDGLGDNTPGCVVRAHHFPMTSEFARSGADGARQTPRCDQRIPCGSSRSTVLRERFAKVNEEMSNDLEYRRI
jgi:hypothetical protein